MQLKYILCMGTFWEKKHVCFYLIIIFSHFKRVFLYISKLSLLDYEWEYKLLDYNFDKLQDYDIIE